MVQRIKTYTDEDFDQIMAPNSTSTEKVFWESDLTKDFMPQQIQEVRFSRYAQSNWGATRPLREVFINELGRESTKVTLEIKVNFNREQPLNAMTSTLTQTIADLDMDLKQSIKQLLGKNCTGSEFDQASLIEPEFMFQSVKLNNLKDG